MKFYIASSLRNIEQVRYTAGVLKSNGWKHTCDWTGFELSSNYNTDSLQIVAEKECDGVRNADIVIVLSPQGRGTHIELGMAIALRKKVYIYHADDFYFKYDDNTCAFYRLPQVKLLTGEIDTAVKVILDENSFS